MTEALKWVETGVLRWRALAGAGDREYEVRYIGTSADPAIQYRLGVREVGFGPVTPGRCLGHFPTPEDARAEAEWRERLEDLMATAVTR